MYFSEFETDAELGGGQDLVLLPLVDGQHLVVSVLREYNVVLGS